MKRKANVRDVHSYTNVITRNIKPAKALEWLSTESKRQRSLALLACKGKDKHKCMPSARQRKSVCIAPVCTRQTLTQVQRIFPISCVALSFAYALLW